MPKSKLTTKLDVVTPEKIAYSNDVEVIEAPAVDGLIGIWPRHAPLVTALKTGIILVKKGEETLPIAISKGFMEVKPDQVNVVVATAELPEEIDVERAEKALVRAEKRLDSEKEGIDRERARAALERARTRIKVVEENKDL